MSAGTCVDVELEFHHRHCLPSSVPSQVLRSNIDIANTMAFVLRRPFAITATIRQVAPKGPQTTARFFHHAPPKPSSPKSKPQPVFAQYKNAFQSTFRRNYTPAASPLPTAQGSLSQRLVYGGALFAGTLIAVNVMFNRETREDGGMPPFEQSYLNETFMVS